MTTVLFIWIIVHLIIHESGHILTTLITGNKVTGFGVSWKGFYMTHSYGTALQNIAVALAGPLANFITYVVLLVIHNETAWLALWMCVFNLLPIPNSDLLHALVYWRDRPSAKRVRTGKSGVSC